MKCDDSFELLAEYLSEEPAAEDELFARYDRGLEISPELWTRIESQIAPAERSNSGWWLGIAAVVVLAVGLGSVFLLSSKEEMIAALRLPQEQPVTVQSEWTTGKTVTQIKRIKKPIQADNPGVVSTDVGSLDLDEQETAKHIEQTENLLRSIRNAPLSDTDDEVDVSYDKALSRRLLIANVILRRDAEMKAKFPTKALLADLEPLLIDIANLPDHAKPEEVRAIKERVQKTEIVAALVDYQDRGQGNR